MDRMGREERIEYARAALGDELAAMAREGMDCWCRCYPARLRRAWHRWAYRDEGRWILWRLIGDCVCGDNPRWPLPREV